MVGLIVNWMLSAVGLFTVSLLVPGFRVTDYESALIVVLVVGLLSSAFGMLLRVATSTGVLTLCAVFLILTDGFLFRLAALVVPGFAMLGMLPAFAGALVVVVLQTTLRFSRVARLGSHQPAVHL